MVFKWVKNCWKHSAFGGRSKNIIITKPLHYISIFSTIYRHPFLTPLFLIGVFIVYLIMGSAAFLFFEFNSHEKIVAKYHFNLLLNR